jgi:hypothetical protein
METAGSRAEGERVGRHARQHAHVTLQPVVPSKIVAAPCQHKHKGWATNYMYGYGRRS